MIWLIFITQCVGFKDRPILIIHVLTLLYIFWSRTSLSVCLSKSSWYQVVYMNHVDCNNTVSTNFIWSLMIRSRLGWPDDATQIKRQNFGLILVDITHVLYAHVLYSAGVETIVWLFLYQWSNPVEIGPLFQRNLLGTHCVTPTRQKCAHIHKTSCVCNSGSHSAQY